MNTGLSFQYPAWWMILCLAAGALYAAVLYYRDSPFDEKATSSAAWKWGMGLFRFTAVSLLAVLLLSPFLRTRHTQTYKPIVAIVQDNSESMRQALGKDTAEYRKKVQELVAQLSSTYEVAMYTAGDALKKQEQVTFQDKSTDLSTAFESINNTYYNQNLGAVVLLSDGIYNRGINPVYTAQKSAYSIYTVALGDTTVQKDQKIANAYFNRLAYLNDKFGVKVDVEANNLAGKKVQLKVYEIGHGPEPQLLQQKEISYTSNNFFQSFDFILSADRTGIAHYRLSVSNVEGEATYRNNVRDIFVEVLDGRQKILLVANSPHPDVAALKTAIESNRNYQLDVEYADNLLHTLNDYNLIILHQLPSVTQPVHNLLTQAKALKKPLLFVIGTQTSIPEFNQAQDVLNIKANATKYNDVWPVINKDFSLFTLSDNTRQALPQWPPVNNFFGNYTASPAAKVLLQQKINSVNTDFPLWLFSDVADAKVGVIAGEGLWRWRLYDYQINKNQDATSELINKTIQFLSVKADKRPFRVNIAKNIFQDNEAVTFDAQLYNANYEPVNTPDADLKITAADGKVYEYHFNKTEKAYELNAGFLPEGNYRYTAVASLGANTYTASGTFSVSPLQLEELRTQADVQVLYQLATQHNGTMHSFANMDKIADEINAKNQLKPVLYDSFVTESAINLRWLFFILALLLALEWAARKYLGGY